MLIRQTTLKTSKVISDPFNDTTNPKRIPGAIVEYTIAISNTSDSEATDVKITDSLDTVITNGEVKFVANSISIVSTSTTKASNFNANTVTATGITVPVGTVAAPGTATVTFQVEIL